MKSVMSHSFSQVPRADIPRSSFNRSHGYKTTFDADYIVPVLVDQVIPGDTFNVNMTFFARLTSPTVLPLMDNLYFESFFFFVPDRLTWPNSKKMHGEQTDPGDSIDYTVPVLGTGISLSTHDLGDYMGLPTTLNTNNDVDISCMPFRGYRLIWNDWFRDENLQDSVEVATDDGPDSNAQCGVTDAPLKRGKRHDYFTSCLPWPQKGSAVELPLGTTAPVGVTSITTGNPVVFDDFDDGSQHRANVSGGSGLGSNYGALAGSFANQMVADLTDATAATINDLRLAFQTQRLLERDARSGTRYNETILAHFGVTIPDYRVQRPEFLGGGSARINISPIAQTTYQGTQTIEDAKGALAGIGTVSGRSGFTKSFTEHGYIFGLINVRSDITYSQGIERFWTKQSRYDFFYPVLAQIGEQSVLNKEIYHQSTGSAGADENVFGYQERYAEYRYKPSRLTGLMAVDAASNLDEFHLSEDFASLPTLDDTFIQSNTSSPLDRAISVPSQPQFVGDFYFDMKCARPMPLYGVPGNLDHF